MARKRIGKYKENQMAENPGARSTRTSENAANPRDTGGLAQISGSRA